MLIENDILRFEKFIINVNNRTTIIDNCEIITNLFIKQRDFFLRRRVLSNHKIIVFSDTQIRISFNYKISDKRKFFRIFYRIKLYYVSLFDKFIYQ